MNLDDFAAAGLSADEAHLRRTHAEPLRNEANDFLVRFAFNRRRGDAQFDRVAVLTDYFSS